MLRSKQQKRTAVSIRILQVTILTILLVMGGRLFQLQIIEFETYGPLSLANSIRQESVNPARGLIFDRSGRLLVDNQPIYTITVTPASFENETIPMLAEFLDVSPEMVESRVQAARRYSWHRPSRLFTDISFHSFSQIQENIWQLPGIGHFVESKRHYPAEAKASHILGYLSEVTREEYNRSRRYNMGDKAGRSGLEFVYEEDLRGELGARYMRVNALGQTLGPYEEGQMGRSPVKGSDIYTHIDQDLQLLAETLMAGKIGGLVAMDPNTGAILAMVSSPLFDVDRLSGRIDMDYWISLQSDTTNPLFNRAISTMQPPGSTVKPLMGLIGLDFGMITPETEITCRGSFIRGREYKCTRAHGRQNLVQAIKNSCNTYFFSLMARTMEQHGLNAWHRHAASFGLGQISGIDLPNERPGILPDSAYYNRHFGGPRDWGIGDLISVGVGQGTFSTSPLHMATLTSELANGGYRIRPHVVDRIVKPDGTILATQPERERIPWIREDHLAIVHEGMRRAVSEGSGRFYADIRGVEVAGKTGTAQNPHGNNHGWFISYAPYDEPEIAIAVLVENAGFGSVSAAPIAGLMMEQYFHGRILRNWVYDYVINFEPEPYDEDEEEVL
ncbi:penicillin-binding protein 2 [Balneolales bacterium ANBcel1]|nr:penicillin-binding protein 2 [Balneolales bacterium ANBcel1]